MRPLYRQTKARIGRPIESRASAEVLFISGGIKAALHTSPAVREKIVKDISTVLNCTPMELEFLFSNNAAQSDDNQIYDFPDSERRRKIIQDNHLDAAE